MGSTTMEICQDSPIVIQSDGEDDDDDVVLVKEEKAQNGNEDDVIFVSEEPAQQSEQNGLVIQKNKTKGRGRASSGSDEDDSFALPQLVSCSSEFSSISVVDDILKPLDLSHGMPQPANISSASSTLMNCAALSTCKPFPGPSIPLQLDDVSDTCVDKAEKVELDLGSGASRDVVDSLLPGTSTKPQRFTPLKLSEVQDPNTPQTLNTPVCKVDLGKECFDLRCPEPSGSSEISHASTTVQDGGNKIIALGTIDSLGAEPKRAISSKCNAVLEGRSKDSGPSSDLAGCDTLSAVQNASKVSIFDIASNLISDSLNILSIPASSDPLVSVDGGGSGIDSMGQNIINHHKVNSEPGSSKQELSHHLSTDQLHGSARTLALPNKTSSKHETANISLNFDHLAPNDVTNLYDFLFPDEKPQAPVGVDSSGASQKASGSSITSDQSKSSVSICPDMSSSSSGTCVPHECSAFSKVSESSGSAKHSKSHTSKRSKGRHVSLTDGEEKLVKVSKSMNVERNKSLSENGMSGSHQKHVKTSALSVSSAAVLSHHLASNSNTTEPVNLHNASPGAPTSLLAASSDDIFITDVGSTALRKSVKYHVNNSSSQSDLALRIKLSAIKRRRSHLSRYLHSKSSSSSQHSKSLSLADPSTRGQDTGPMGLSSHLKSFKAKKHHRLHKKRSLHDRSATDDVNGSSKWQIVSPGKEKDHHLVIKRAKVSSASGEEASERSGLKMKIRLSPGELKSGSSSHQRSLSSSSLLQSQPSSYDKGLKKAFIKRQSSLVAVPTSRGAQPQTTLHRSISETTVKGDKVKEYDVQMWCVTCIKPNPSSKLSKCGSGHGVCATCLEGQVKAILTGEVKQKNIKCPANKCVKILTFDELKQTLPPFVVDILEEKLDKEYLSYITKWMFTDEKLKSRSEFATSDTRTPPCPALNMRKYEEIYTQESRDLTEDLPTFWTPMERGAPVMVYEVVPDTDEYTALAIQFHETLSFGQYDIVRIIRVQNPILWKYFALKRSEMVQENDGMDVTEKQLYHGTHRSTLEAIARKGFDWRLSGKHGTVYGCGSYFATTARYSHGYSDRGGNAVSVKNGGYSSSHINPPSFGPAFGLVPGPSLNHPSSLLLSRLFSRSQCIKTISQPSGLPQQVQTSFVMPPLTGPSCVIFPSTVHQPPPAHYHLPPPPPAHGQLSSLQMPAHNQTSSHTSMKSASSSAIGGISSNVPHPPSSSAKYPAPPLATPSGLTGVSHALGSGGQSISAPHQTGSGQPQPLSFDAGNNYNSSYAGASSNLQVPSSSFYPGAIVGKGASSAQNSSSSISGNSSINGSDVRESKTASSSSGPSKISRAHERGTADLSSAFSRPSHAQTHFMFVARVLVGRYTGGKSGLKRPPPLDENNPFGKSYDSCVDHIFSPQVFVIFDSNQAYPEYVIEYNWNKDA